jgi:outer membrane receptor protein involved in Fe transport
MSHSSEKRFIGGHGFSLPALSAAIISINALAISSQVQAEEQTDDDTAAIIVIGEKIDKSLQETTNAVTVFSGDDAQKDGANSEPNDIASTVPNVVEGRFGSVNIRGINGNGAATGGLIFISGARARVATNIDGVADAFTGYNYSPSGLWDVEQCPFQSAANITKYNSHRQDVYS